MEKRPIKKLIMGIFMLGFGVWLLIWSLARIADDNNLETDTDIAVSDDAVVDENSEAVSAPAEDTVEYSHKADLQDVTFGETLQGINTGGNASGVAQSIFKDETYMLYAEFSNLPDPVNGSFYEGWLVEKETGDFFSTGVVDKDESGVYVDTYTDSQDWNKSHTFYVLTLEPNDNDSAPADHIVEAVLEET